MSKNSAGTPPVSDDKAQSAASLLWLWASNASKLSGPLGSDDWLAFGDAGGDWAKIYPQEYLWFWFNGQNSDNISADTCSVKFKCIQDRRWWELTSLCLGDQYFELVGWLDTKYGSYKQAFVHLAANSGPGYMGSISLDRFSPTWNAQPHGPRCSAEHAFAFFDADGDGEICDDGEGDEFCNDASRLRDAHEHFSTASIPS
jgi:hypothetical protein